MHLILFTKYLRNKFALCESSAGKLMLETSCTIGYVLSRQNLNRVDPGNEIGYLRWCLVNWRMCSSRCFWQSYHMQQQQPTLFKHDTFSKPLACGFFKFTLSRTQPGPPNFFLANHKTSSEQKNRSSFISD